MWVKCGPFLLVDAKMAKSGYVRDTKTVIIKKWINVISENWL